MSVVTTNPSSNPCLAQGAIKGGIPCAASPTNTIRRTLQGGGILAGSASVLRSVGLETCRESEMVAW